MGMTKMTAELIMQHITASVLSMMITVALFDSLMEVLQGKDNPWRIGLENKDILTHLLFLYGGSGIGYCFGYGIAQALPSTQPNELFVIGIVFGSMAAMIVRGYHMLHFHRVRREQKSMEKNNGR